jgi:L-lactate utilization protein LutC
MTPRDHMLARIRQAVRDGNAAGHAPPLPERGTVGYQGAGDDPISRLRDELTAAGGVFHPVGSWAEACVRVVDLLKQRNCRRVLVGPGLPGVAAEIQAAGIQPILTEQSPSRDDHFAADAGVSGADHIVAETGTIALTTRPDQPRSLSLLPPIHIAIASRAQLVADLFDLFQSANPPACLSLITGPSKTGDIELKLVTGVHGPGELHLIFLGR